MHPLRSVSSPSFSSLESLRQPLALIGVVVFLFAVVGEATGCASVPPLPPKALGLAECLLRLDREQEADDVITRARRRFGDTPEMLMLVARQLLRREAYADAEEILAPLTEDADRPRAGAAWSWIGVARLARGDR